MRRKHVVFAVLPVLLAGSGARAQDLPGLDAYRSAPAVAAASQAAPAARRGVVESWDSRRGVPTFFWADRTNLAARAASAPPAPPEKRAFSFLVEHADLYGLSPEALQTAYVKHIHDTGRGGVLVTFGQRIAGVEVFETEAKVLLDRQGLPVAIGGNLHGAAAPLRARKARTFPGAMASAVAVAAGDLLGTPVQVSDLEDLRKEKAGYHYYSLAALAAAGTTPDGAPTRAKEVLYPLPDRLVPAYYIEVGKEGTAQERSKLYGYVVAGSGEILARRSLVDDLAVTYRVWADPTYPFTPLPGPLARRSHLVPDGIEPDFVPPNLVTVDGLNTAPGGGTDPWLPDTATETHGNNVDAYADLVWPDGFNPETDVRATMTGPRTFDRTYNVTLDPAASQDQIMASVTDLFYINNWLHDYFYDSGFNEAAGNAQALNFGRGGVEGDELHAEAQDFSGMDNANMYTPADGEHPRMQMYIFQGREKRTLEAPPVGIITRHRGADFGPDTFSISGDLVLVDDGKGNPNDGCEVIHNDVEGKVVLMDSGACSAESQVMRAQFDGAIGVLLASTVPGQLPAMPDDYDLNGVTIGSLGITKEAGDALKQSLENGGTIPVRMTRGPGPLRDGAIDGDTVAHEWGHYLHHRLMYCGYFNQCGAESEGWGDFNALLMKIRPGDDVLTGTFSVGGYAFGAQPDAAYFGFRRFPYTRDMTKNGLTFRHIEEGVPLPPGPQQPNWSDNYEVHNAGEVWASMLFQAYTNLLLYGGHAFADAKRRMADYVVLGMKLAPANATFTEQRDALVAAALSSDPADSALLEQGFAQRGAGTCAVSPDRFGYSGRGVVESFVLSGRLAIEAMAVDDSVQTCDGDGVLDAGEVGRFRITVRNTGRLPLLGTMLTVTSSNPDLQFPNGNTLLIPEIPPAGAVDVSLNIALDPNVTAITDTTLDVELDNASSCEPTMRATLPVRLNYDDLPNASTTETVDSENPPWTRSSPSGISSSFVGTSWAREADATRNFRFHGLDYPRTSDTALVTPDLLTSATDPLVVSFDHSYQFEDSYDGGVIEISDDAGATWRDVSEIVSPGYTDTIPSGDNPLQGRQAFMGENPSWPASDTVVLDFGTAFPSKTVRLRFRAGSDYIGGDPEYQGWFLDNISVRGITNLPFHLVIADPPGCGTPPPPPSDGDDL